MAQTNGIHKDQLPTDPARPMGGRVISASMMRSAVMSTSEPSPSTETAPWSSAVGHASTGKSGRVIERLQGDIDKLHREKQLLKMRHDEIERANEAMAAQNQYLQDRNSNYEHTHEANLRQISRKERQVEELKEELKREKQKLNRAEEQAQTALANEEAWREQATRAKAIASQRENEYEAMVSCRNMDHDRHQAGLDRVKSGFEALLRQWEDDTEKQKRLEIIAEQQRQTISQLDELTRRINANFKTYRTAVDTVIAELRETASTNDDAVNQKLRDMVEVTGHMRWVMKVDEVVNGNTPLPMPETVETQPVPRTEPDIIAKPPTEEIRPRSPSKLLLGFDVRGKHRRKDTNKGGK